MPITGLNATFYKRSQVSSVGITMGYSLGQPVLGFQQGQEIFIHSTMFRQALGSTPVSYPMGIGVILPGGKVREA
jgi:hypothetical protein